MVTPLGANDDWWEGHRSAATTKLKQTPDNVRWHDDKGNKLPGHPDYKAADLTVGTILTLDGTQQVVHAVEADVVVLHSLRNGAESKYSPARLAELLIDHRAK